MFIYFERRDNTIIIDKERDGHMYRGKDMNCIVCISLQT